MGKSVLVVGASGFIGGYITQEGIKRGYDSYAGVRQSSSKEYLTDSDINFIEFDFTDVEVLRTQISEGLSSVGGRWDYIVYNLGATKCINFMDFSRINYQYLRDFCSVLIELNAVPEKFIYISTLGVLGVGDETNYTPFDENSTAKPNTKYGLSKLKSEIYLQGLDNFPYIIFRPTGVYGAHEQDYLMMIKSIERGWDFGAGYKRQVISFLYVEDLVSAIYDVISSTLERKIYILSDGNSYSSADFRRITAKLLDKRFVIAIKLPLAIVKLVSIFAQMWGDITFTPSTLNRDKFLIMKQRNWGCDISAAQRDFNFNPKFDLERGLTETIKWYKGGGRLNDYYRK